MASPGLNRTFNRPAKVLIRGFFLSTLVVTATGCATFARKAFNADKLIRQRKFAEAAKMLQPKAEKDGDDQVVYLFDYGTALQLSGDYKSSNRAFLKAEDLTVIKNYHSISRITGSLLLNEGMVQYKGEDYEKVYLNAMLAVNYLMLHNLDDARVETRKLNEKLYKYKFEARRNYEQDPFAFYLSAMIWEDGHSWDDAYIDFTRAYKVNPAIPYLKEDLLRAARRAHRRDAFDSWRKKFPGAKLTPENGKGQIVLVFEQGWAPQKRPNPKWPRVPELFPVRVSTIAANLVVDGAGSEKTEVITSVEDVAMKTLNDAYAKLVAKRIAGVMVKRAVAKRIYKDNKLLGQLAWLGMNIADQADLRQWTTLPSTFQVAKMYVSPGKYKVHVDGLNAAGAKSGESSSPMDVVVRAGHTSFITWRSVL